MLRLKQTGDSSVLAAFVLVLLVAGCSSGSRHPRDLVDEGRYRLESDRTENGRCLTRFEVRERDGKMVVTGKRNVSRRCDPTPPPVVEVVEPSGRLFGRQRAALSKQPHSRTGHSHATFHVEFDSLPPPGSLIRILYDDAPLRRQRK